MNLEVFIKDTLIGIRNGVQEANSATDTKPYRMSTGSRIDFNIAVQVIKENEKTIKGKAGLDVAGFIQVVGVEAEGIEGSTEGNISRIKFSVEVAQTREKGIR